MNLRYKNVFYRKKYVWMVNIYKERCLMALNVRQIQTKITIYYFHLPD